MTDTLTVAEVLTKAADLIEPEGKWTKHEFARKSDGTPLANGWDAEAACWCALGAIEHVTGPDGYHAASICLSEALPGTSVASFNDRPQATQAEVVAKLREAAERAKGGEA